MQSTSLDIYKMLVLIVLVQGPFASPQHPWGWLKQVTRKKPGDKCSVTQLPLGALGSHSPAKGSQLAQPLLLRSLSLILWLSVLS